MIHCHAESFFVAIEGLDGSGKSEAARRIADALRARGSSEVKATYEPEDDCCAGGFIRQMLRKELPFSPYTLALAYAANRADHVDRVLLPALAKPRSVVITDRYYLSSLAYQVTDQTSLDDVMFLNRAAIKPDVWLFFDVTAQTALQRIAVRGARPELFESRMGETRARYERAMTYLRARGESIILIDANGNRDEVLSRAMQAILARAPAWV